MSTMTHNPAPVATEDFDVFEVARLLEGTETESGSPFLSLVEHSPVLLVFLRHSGCTFCRESLSDISTERDSIEAAGNRIVLVHMGDQEGMRKVVSRYGLADLERISDPDRKLYNAFGLKRGTVGQLGGAKVWWRGLVAGLIRGHGWGSPTADPRQMPGVFYIDKGMIARHYRHRSAADRPKYGALCHGDD